MLPWRHGLAHGCALILKHVIVMARAHCELNNGALGKRLGWRPKPTSKHIMKADVAGVLCRAHDVYGIAAGGCRCCPCSCLAWAGDRAAVAPLNGMQLSVDKVAVGHTVLDFPATESAWMCGLSRAYAPCGSRPGGHSRAMHSSRMNVTASSAMYGGTCTAPSGG